MGYFNEKAKQFISEMILDELPKINVKSGRCRYNYRCQLNAVNDALNDGHHELAMCFYFDDNRPIIHFLNLDKDGNYIDNTLGRWSETMEYYLIKNIKEKDYFSINDIFTKYREELNTKLPFFVRWFSDVTF